ncbi:MAG: HAD family phosphatase [Acidimicrobiia bacterium]
MTTSRSGPDGSLQLVAFDLGGVVLESPLHEIARLEEESGVTAGLINQAVQEAGPAGAWARLERGELGMESFVDLFTGDLGRIGVRGVDVADLMRRIEAVAVARPAMVAAIDRLRAAGLKVAAVTNSWRSRAAQRVSSHFDLVIESHLEGTRKPEARIFRLLIERSGVTPDRIVFLDDIGVNLKAAREMGMHTIKVDHPLPALEELSDLVGLNLV